MKTLVTIVTLGLLLTPSFAMAQASGTPLQGFSVVLVLGDLSSGTTADNIPPAARAALADLKDFLPYKGYRVLDTAWILASASTRQDVTGRLRGPDEQDYEVVLDRTALAQAPGSAPAAVQIRFVLREPDSNMDRRMQALQRESQRRQELSDLMANISAMRTQLKKAEASQNRGDADAIRQRISDLEIAIETRQNQSGHVSGAPTLIDTSFNMSLGETVVVGTSRVGGDKALIALLTAVTRGTKPRE
jgi:hypothetical protein